MNKEGKESRKIHRIELREIFDKEEFKKTLKKRSVEYFCIIRRIRVVRCTVSVILRVFIKQGLTVAAISCHDRELRSAGNF